MNDFFSKDNKRAVNLASHITSDMDDSRDALHHTLGPAATQAAPGNHTTHGQTTAIWTPNVRNSNDSALAHTLNMCSYRRVDNVCFWEMIVTINAAGVSMVRFSLPLFGTVPPSRAVAGWGREDALTGVMVFVGREDAVQAMVFRYDNGATAVNGYRLTLAGHYILDGV